VAVEGAVAASEPAGRGSVKCWMIVEFTANLYWTSPFDSEMRAVRMDFCRACQRVYDTAVGRVRHTMISEFHCSVWAWLYVVALLKALLQA
jgi:hypothetical protein